MSDKVKHPVFWTVFLSIVSLAWVYPIVLVLINSFKQKAYISRNAFSLPVDVRLVDCTYEQLGCAPAVHTVPV